MLPYGSINNRPQRCEAKKVELSRLSSYLAVIGALAAAGRAEEVDRALDAIQTYEGGIPHRAFVVRQRRDRLPTVGLLRYFLQ